MHNCWKKIPYGQKGLNKSFYLFWVYRRGILLEQKLFSPLSPILFRLTHVMYQRTGLLLAEQSWSHDSYMSEWQTSAFFLIFLKKKKKKKKKDFKRLMPNMGFWQLALIWYFLCTFDTGDCLTLTMLWADSADDKLMIFFLFFLENRNWHFMQIVSNVDNLHEVSSPIF